MKALTTGSPSKAADDPVLSAYGDAVVGAGMLRSSIEISRENWIVRSL